MTKRLIATVLAGALAFTSLPTAPAQADDELGKILAAGTVLFILGKAIQMESDKGSRKKEVHRHHAKPAPKKQVQHKRHHQPQHVHRSARLPGYCLTRVHTWDGPRNLVSARCLRNNYAYADSLPRQCFRRLETRDGVRRGYGPRCLQQRGYVIAGR